MNQEMIETKSTIGGAFRARVFDKNRNLVADHGWQNNLILPAGVGVGFFRIQMDRCHVGTGSTPNSIQINGTFQQTGTTVSRVAGTAVFVSGNVGDFIKFQTGETARIVSLTNSVTVEVDRTQTVAATTVTLYDTSRVFLDNWVKVSTSDATIVINQNTDARSTTFTGVHDFSAETQPRTYTEVGVNGSTSSTSQLFSRILFESPVTVDVEQFLQVEYKVTNTVTRFSTPEPFTPEIAGWPHPYGIQSITSNGTNIDVVLDSPHHYQVGRPINITGALPASNPITSITSTSSAFTVTTSGAHGRAVGDSIVIAGSTPAGYNGSWVVQTVPSSTRFTVASAVNLGNGSGGTTRLATPSQWYDGQWTIASFPNANTIRIESQLQLPPAGAAGNVTNSAAATAIVYGFGWGNYDAVFDINPSKNCRILNSSEEMTGLAYGSIRPIQGTSASNTSGSYDALNRRLTLVRTFASAVGNGNVKQLVLRESSSGIAITFDELQVKEVGFQLALTWVLSWEPELN